MTLNQFIDKLNKFRAENPGSGEYPVCLADWADDARYPCEEAAECISVEDGEFFGVPGWSDRCGLIVLIGGA